MSPLACFKTSHNHNCCHEYENQEPELSLVTSKRGHLSSLFATISNQATAYTTADLATNAFEHSQLTATNATSLQTYHRRCVSSSSFGCANQPSAYNNKRKIEIVNNNTSASQILQANIQLRCRKLKKFQSTNATYPKSPSLEHSSSGSFLKMPLRLVSPNMATTTTAAASSQRKVLFCKGSTWKKSRNVTFTGNVASFLTNDATKSSSLCFLAILVLFLAVTAEFGLKPASGSSSHRAIGDFGVRADVDSVGDAVEFTLPHDWKRYQFRKTLRATSKTQPLFSADVDVDVDELGEQDTDKVAAPNWRPRTARGIKLAANGDTKAHHHVMPTKKRTEASILRKPRALFYPHQHLGTTGNHGAVLQQDEPNVETYLLTSGTNGSLPCYAFPAQPNTVAKVEWFKDDKLILETSDLKRIVEWNLNKASYLPETGNLFFKSIASADSGEYRCRVTKKNNNGVDESAVRFYVKGAPDPPPMPIVLSQTQTTANVSWAPSLDYHYSPISHYFIQTREGDSPDGVWDEANAVATPDNRTHYQVVGLKPFTAYSFRIIAVNGVGPSEPSKASYYFKTLRQKPDSVPRIKSAHNVSSSAIQLEWLKPEDDGIHGEPLGYKIRYVHQLREPISASNYSTSSNSSSSHSTTTFSFNLFGSLSSTTSNNLSSMATNDDEQLMKVTQPSLDSSEAREIIVRDPSTTSILIKGLATYTPYKFSVQVFNMAGEGPKVEVLAMTDEGVPSAPLDVAAHKVADTNARITWKEPRAINGPLQGYIVHVRDVAESIELNKTVEQQPAASMDYLLANLKPNTHYAVSVRSRTLRFLGELSREIRFKTDVSPPNAPTITNLSCAPDDRAMKVTWTKPEQRFLQTNIDYYIVQYRSSSLSASSAIERGFESQTTAYANDGSVEFREIILKAFRDKLINEVTIKDLHVDEAYEVRVIAGVKSTLHRDEQSREKILRSAPSDLWGAVLREGCKGYSSPLIPETAFNTSLAIGIVCALFALILASASLVIWRRHCQAAYYYLDDPQSPSPGTNSPNLSETYDGSEYGAICVNDWAKHVQKLHADSDIGFAKEFEQIQKAPNHNLTSAYSLLPENKHKNRYINIVAYDHTRVTLRPLPGPKKNGSDYINANFIDGYNKPRAYIGTQGPLVSTFDDYWRMIWEQRVVIMVMITNLQERGRRKCDMYWPKEGTETYGHIQVKLLQEVVMATYILRTFTAKNLKLKKRAGSERTVYQYHYTNWPDHGVPDHPLPVLSFVRKSASANPQGAGAIICHCSAGCGRSGTYIVIDAMLKQIRHRQSINVYDFLKHIRSQRNYLVQTEEQYIFIHDSLVEAINSGDTEVATRFISQYLVHLQANTNSTALDNPIARANASSQKGSSYSIVSQANGVMSTNTTIAQPTTPLETNHLLPTQNIQQNGPLLMPNGTSTDTALRSAQSVTSGSSPSQWSLLERQYRLVASFKAKDFNVVSALKPCNKAKNRTLNLIPLEAHRVHITPKPGLDGSDYINATFIMGFNNLREFIVTQHPTHETFSDFWQMVYDHNSQTIVLLTQMGGPDSQEFAQFWPLKEDEVDYGSFKVKLTQESAIIIGGSSNQGATIGKGSAAAAAAAVAAATAAASSGKGNGKGVGLVITRDFIMRSNQDDYELQTRVIHCPGWPHNCGSLTNVFDLIQIVQSATQRHNAQQQAHDGYQSSQTVTIGQEHEPQNGGPIIVVDKFGGTEAATFAVLTTLYKQINFEDAVDVYMYAKLAHLRRPGIWRSQDDYLFLYKTIESYASQMLAALNKGQNNLLALSNGKLDQVDQKTAYQRQTMTLGRHSHKSASSFVGSTSTMRRSDMNRNSASNMTIDRSKLNALLSNGPKPGAIIQQQHQAALNNKLINNTIANGILVNHASSPSNNSNNHSSNNNAHHHHPQSQPHHQTIQQNTLSSKQSRPQNMLLVGYVPPSHQQLQPVVSAHQLQLQRQLQRPTPLKPTNE